LVSGGVMLSAAKHLVLTETLRRHCAPAHTVAAKRRRAGRNDTPDRKPPN